MTNPANAAIYAFGGFMLFALAIEFSPHRFEEART
jgi:hypothetical protein